MKPRKVEIKVRYPREARPVKIIADAGVSTRGRHGGRMLPLLILDTSDRPDLSEFIRHDDSLGPGDVITQWGRLDGKEYEGTVALYVTSIRPIELFVILQFEIVSTA